MTGIVRLGDNSSHGGSMITANGRFKVNGIQACVNGDLHSCPIPGHGTTAIVSVSPTKSNGQCVSKIGDQVGCGAVIVSGSQNSFIDNGS